MKEFLINITLGPIVLLLLCIAMPIWLTQDWLKARRAAPDPADV